ncbi:MAG: glycosyltransferase family 2 protein [Muribaculaceae bacterium]|nr:glycosyltransferase family 2 protein [Muribaculaceae bacterium]
MVSIIIPVYNLELYIASCLESVLNQTYKDIEVIVVNDGSTDSSQMIIDAYCHKDCRIKALRKSNGGLTSARNYGLSYATGEWIMHLDGDDWLNDSAVERFIAEAESTQADIVIGGLNFVWHNRAEQVIPPYCNSDFNLADYISSTWTTLCGSFQRKAIYDKYDLQSPEQISYCEDFHLMVRLCHYSKIVRSIPDCNYNYRQRETSIIHSYSSKTEDDELWAYNDIYSFLKSVNRERELAKPMAWRALKASQEMLLDVNRHQQYINYMSWKKEYILSCPFYNFKQKLMAWSLTHGVSIVARTIVALRNMAHHK